jgi:hypothetical protein
VHLQLQHVQPKQQLQLKSGTMQPVKELALMWTPCKFLKIVACTVAVKVVLKAFAVFVHQHLHLPRL